MTWRPKRFRLGAMRDRIDLIRDTMDESSGEPNIASSTTVLDNEPASFDPVTGGESLRGRQVDATLDALFVVRWRNDYRTQDKVRLITGSGGGGITWAVGSWESDAWESNAWADAPWDGATASTASYDEYGIVAVLPVEGGRRYIELHCRRDGV